ncbi:non-hydrolyzing UDP-N-acetylglucosamine 2-epimerase [Amycolatopsis viridis]|uniref:UDP-N-acetylglucosamine 2-epimerase (non-hydrolyzing) n=1 Tax=Amycolatopsis viridis TaxID=185678 RepID=A0ABX0SWE8_9PSEU|nr:UDP-N-acetylglucosamine 2-epimerase (non-hydrolyzing) [Amycolatopsis viridis]NIH80242.1 UDP-N-acetylglucosamine 2-epimerase (non-hydrolysing) [Amycolatopsis viridis]
MDIMLLAGTRPEAVKLAPLALALPGHPVLRPVIVHSGQHDGMVEQALAPFGLLVDDRLPAPVRRNGGQAELVAGLLPSLDGFLRRRSPAAVVVQGDTTTVLAGALAAFWRGIPVVHLEAGLRTHDLAAPFPEEGTRQMVSRLAALHLAPTGAAVAALLGEGVPAERIVLTGNTVVDAVEHIAARGRPAQDRALAAAELRLLEQGRRLVLVTSHRRESWGKPLQRVLSAVRDLVRRRPDVEVLFPVHPNPAVRDQVTTALSGVPRITVTGPLEYPDLVRALRLATVVLTDSGGIQEEAPSFGTPVVVLRDTTERREAIASGHARLVGTDPAAIGRATEDVLSGRWRPASPANPYGDGKAALRAVAAIGELLAVPSRSRVLAPPEPVP